MATRLIGPYTSQAVVDLGSNVPPAGQTATFTLQIQNFFNLWSTTVSVMVTRATLPVPNIAIRFCWTLSRSRSQCLVRSGPPLINAHRWSSVTLTGSSAVPSCVWSSTVPAMSFAWSVTSGGAAVALPGVKLNTPLLTIPAFVLQTSFSYTGERLAFRRKLTDSLHTDSNTHGLVPIESIGHSQHVSHD